MVPALELEERELLSRCEPYEAELPSGVKLLLASIDTQDSSLEYLVIGVGDGHEFWCLERGAILGNPTDDAAGMFKEVDERIFGRYWESLDGKLMRVAVGVQDAMGHHSAAVYDGIRRRPRRRLLR